MKTLKLNHLWRYDDSAPLGTPGGFAAVYPGISEDDRPVAIKVFHASVTPTQAQRELEFARSRVGEAGSHVVTVHDCGTDASSGQHAIVMARGEHSLADYLKTHGAFPEAAACGVGAQIAHGLLEVHDWVHRDLKPANVLWCEGRWQVMDFGIARVADASTAAETMKYFQSNPYAAPEQWNQERATHATDVYALGCIVHELMTGQPLFQGTEDDVARQHRYQSPQVTAGSPSLQAFLRGMLAKPLPARPTLEDVAQRLRWFTETSAVPPRPPSALAVVSAAVSAQRSEQEAAEAEAKAAARTRAELRDHALPILLQIRHALFERIREEAPNAQILESGNHRSSEMKATLGKGELTMTVGHTRDVPAGTFSHSRWDVVCWDVIRCSTGSRARSASLWYVKDRSGVWRWLEASYWSLARSAGANEPCSLPPGDDADFAAAPITHSWLFAHQPRAVEGDDQQAFIERWIGHFAQAAQGNLQRPSRLPED